MSSSINIISLVVQFVFLALGIYVYLFSRGFIKFGDAAVRKRSETFRKENATWMRYTGLALAAVMLANIVLQLMGR
ncbi:MAG: hypothetical protein AAF828_06075 [Bacteroidota bacterium]